MLTEKKLTDFLDDLASDLPAPGGGGAAALSGAMGACLISMVARLTIGKKGYEDVWSEMEQVISKSDQLYKHLSAQIDEDAAVFNDVISALKMPKEDEAQIKLRTQVMQQTFKRAAEVPCSIAENCLEILNLAAGIVKRSNINLVSDIGVAAELALAGLESSLLNVRINLPYIKDEEFVAKIKKQMESLTDSAKTIKNQVLTEVAGQIG